MPYFVTDDNCNLYYELNGKGRAVVLIHGWSCCRHHFRQQIDFLRDRYQVLSYDLRGHGDSERTESGLTLSRFAKDLRELIRHCDLKDVTLVGWSMGTSVIFEHVRQFGCDNVSRLCLIDMTPRLSTGSGWTMGIYGNYDADRVMRDLHAMADDWENMIRASIPALFAHAESSGGIFDWAYKTALKNTPHVLIAMWIALWTNDYREELKKITIPTLIAYGDSSRLYTPEVARYMGENIKNSKVMEFKGCGHALHMEDPERFNKALTDLIG